MILGIGTDIVEHRRINLKIAKRLLTENEYKHYLNLNQEIRVEYLASRFAAKEAIVKATNKKYVVNQIEILNTISGKPYCSNIDGIQLSISHEREYSVAFAIYEN